MFYNENKAVSFSNDLSNFLSVYECAGQNDTFAGHHFFKSFFVYTDVCKCEKSPTFLVPMRNEKVTQIKKQFDESTRGNSAK